MRSVLRAMVIAVGLVGGCGGGHVDEGSSGGAAQGALAAGDGERCPLHCHQDGACCDTCTYDPAIGFYCADPPPPPPDPCAGFDCGPNPDLICVVDWGGVPYCTCGPTASLSCVSR